MNKETKAERLNDLLTKLVHLRRKCAKSKSAKVHREFEAITQKATQELDYLVKAKTRRYRGFSNYDDLCQDGRLALYLALQSYDPEKGDFYLWANKYIKTKISREANKHSTIKIPLKHTKQVLPYKVSQLPVIVDNDPNALENIQKDEVDNMIRMAVKKLPDDQRMVIELHYEMTGNKRDCSSIGKICDRLNITRLSCTRLLEEARKNLKQELSDLY